MSIAGFLSFFFLIVDDETKDHEKLKKNLEMELTELEQKHEKDVMKQKLTKDKDSIIQIIENRKIKQVSSVLINLGTRIDKTFHIINI